MSAAVTIANWCDCFGCQMRGQGTCGCFTCPECMNASDVLLETLDIDQYGREVRERCKACRECSDCGGTDDHEDGCSELSKWDAVAEPERDESRFERERLEGR